MKKFFCAIFSFVLVSLLCFTGCFDGWTEVQSITYHTDSRSNTYTSMIYCDITVEYIKEADYNEAPESQKNEFYFKSSYSTEIDIDRKQFLDEFNNNLKDKNIEIGKTYYSTYYDDMDWDQKNPFYIKYTINYQELRYVKVKFVDNDCLEISYYEEGKNKTVKVQPTSYEITYFED